MPKAKNDVKLDIFHEMLGYLAADLPVTREKDTDRKGEKDVWYSSQKVHLIGWTEFQDTTGGGKYTRSKGNKSAKTMYNRFLNINGLLWMAEAFGEQEDVLRRAYDAGAAAM